MKKILFISTLDSKLDESDYIINKLNRSRNKLIIFDVGIQETKSIKSHINRSELIKYSGLGKKN